jgi:hypothetical protein
LNEKPGRSSDKDAGDYLYDVVSNPMPSCTQDGLGFVFRLIDVVINAASRKIIVRAIAAHFATDIARRVALPASERCSRG